MCVHTSLCDLSVPDPVGEAESGEDQCYTYMLLCADNTLYTGWTNHLQKRLQMHNSGRGAKYTRSRLPVKLVYYESFPSRQEAMSREWHLKKMSRKEKLTLVHAFSVKNNCEVPLFSL